MGNAFDEVSVATPWKPREGADDEEGALGLFEDFRDCLTVEDFFGEAEEEDSDPALGVDVFLATRRCCLSSHGNGTWILLYPTVSMKAFGPDLILSHAETRRSEIHGVNITIVSIFNPASPNTGTGDDESGRHSATYVPNRTRMIN
ncbi:MAG: hypothetical protein NPIRA03_11350 [Nitrospirales bacterium]|nr:MAG: hypothetical protein NPIRA03_11350 [Nitrospirales bacterium]